MDPLAEPIGEPRGGAPVAQTKTLETIRLNEAIDAFEKEPTVENHSSVKLAFAKLDSEIAELDDLMVKSSGSDRADAAAKLNNLQQYRAAQLVRFPKSQDETFEGLPARNSEAGALTPGDSRSAAQKAEDAAAKVGGKIEDGAKKVERTLEKAAKKTGEAVHDATH